MKIIIGVLFFSAISISITAQTIDKAKLAKYSLRIEQEKVLDRQINFLKMNAKQAAEYKIVSFHYIDMALAIVNANINNSMYTLYRKIKPVKTAHAAAMKTILTTAQLDAWNEDRKKNGIITKIVR